MNFGKGFFRLTLGCSIFVGIIISLYYGWFFNKMEVDVTLPENWKRMSIQEKLNNLDKLLSKETPFFLISRVRQLNIRKQLRKLIVAKEDELLRDGCHYRFGFCFYIGWKELGLLGMVGFASVWGIYVLAKGVILLIPYALSKHFPSPPSKEQVAFPNFPRLYEAMGLDSIGERPLVPALEERPKKPRKTRAVWID
jgi:hypothetical protein